MSLELAALDAAWQLTFELAWEAWRAGTIPIGAVLTDPTGSVVASGRNRIFDTSAAPGHLSGSWISHAEVNALAQLPAGDHAGYAITSTTEPCLLCAGAITMSLHGRVVVRYAVDDPIAGGMDAARMAPQGRRRDFVVERMPDPAFVVFADAINLAESIRRAPQGIVASHYKEHRPELFAAAVELRTVLDPLIGTDAPLDEALMKAEPVLARPRESTSTAREGSAMRSTRPSLTARWVASNRARLDDRRPTLASGDPDAERRLYAGLSLRALALPGMTPTGALHRTSFFDDEVVAALHRGVRQVVIVGAGYDGRPLRFGPPAIWIEVDHPVTQADKRRRLSRLDVDLSHLRFAPVDLMSDDLNTALADAGHDLDLPTVFLCEGLFAYLPLDVCRSVCSSLRGRATPGSTLAANFLIAPSPGTRGHWLRMATDGVLALIGERRRTAFHAGDGEELFHHSGWRVIRKATSETESAKGGYLLLLAGEPA